MSASVVVMATAIFSLLKPTGTADNWLEAEENCQENETRLVVIGPQDVTAILVDEQQGRSLTRGYR